MTASKRGQSALAVNCLSILMGGVVTQAKVTPPVLLRQRGVRSQTMRNKRRADLFCLLAVRPVRRREGYLKIMSLPILFRRDKRLTLRSFPKANKLLIKEGALPN